MTDETYAGNAPVRFTSPGELLASLPQMIGFYPSDSVVLLANAHSGSRHVGPVMRCDLPAEPEVREVAVRLVEAITRAEPASVVTVVIGGTSGAPVRGHRGLPQRALVRELREQLRASKVTDPAALWLPSITGGVGWRCYDHARCGGVLPDPGSTVAAARIVDQGLVTFGSREELQRLVVPDDNARARTRADHLVAELRSRPQDAAAEAARGIEVVRDALLRVRRGDFELTDQELATLARAVSDTRVRDACLATVVPPHTADAHTAERLWQWLARVLPAPERAQPAVLAGYSAYAAGNGALARIALESALESDPDHVLAALLLRALQGGVQPRTIRALAGTGERTGGCIDLPPDAAAGEDPGG
ncbi:DUF4192 domain-containing protein [Haloechinothrix sp. LS1_15]|uniref:DUF4192 domain-containing protein n=1 Tax=Haloechinothrix sp. LS1_15 TaxID=2652248 RepID=UPI002946FC9A|nr:DUF4192 domain-containing protein [Haloechinothrix sp. LS1_15]MDV6014483.1 DUF4192 domain-containing protein [Haloechinothrix sp. LS1_15]